MASGRLHRYGEVGGVPSEVSLLEEARRSRRSYAPLCGERLYLRNASPGHKTAKEWATDLLRDHVWRGERIVGFVLDTFYRDAHRVTSALRPGTAARPPEQLLTPD